MHNVMLEAEAYAVARSHGWDHANYVSAYGGDLHQPPAIPDRFASVADTFTEAYAVGVQQYLDEDLL